MLRRRSLGLALWALGACGQVPVDDDDGLLEEAVQVCPKGMMTRGIDVSHWDGTIDWALVKGDNVEFAFMKATEGNTFVDSQYATNWGKSAGAGVIRSAYHFFRPAIDPIAQANHFIQVAGVPLPGDLPPTMDLEVTDNLSDAEVHTRALQFLQRVEELTGRIPILYTSARFLGTIRNMSAGLDRYVLWVVDWHIGRMCPDVPSPPWMDWVFWQYSNLGKIAGIAPNTDVDLNHFNGSLDDLRKFTGTRSSGDGGDGGRDGGSDLLAPAADLSTTPTGAAPPQGCTCAVASRKAPPPLALLLALLLIVGALRNRGA
ncbi:MAG: hypothetical protein EXR72_14725 [Myxococcales bacterium]|nr:hypothetical protein [Myxococcales bacterium]